MKGIQIEWQQDSRDVFGEKKKRKVMGFQSMSAKLEEINIYFKNIPKSTIEIPEEESEKDF